LGDFSAKPGEQNSAGIPPVFAQLACQTAHLGWRPSKPMDQESPSRAFTFFKWLVFRRRIKYQVGGQTITVLPITSKISYCN
jgi:hypothetical protein